MLSLDDTHIHAILRIFGIARSSEDFCGSTEDDIEKR
jgi:hypothetical protein